MTLNWNVKTFVALALLSLPMGACQRENENVGPDLTTPLTGQFPATYLIAPIGSNQTFSGANSFVKFERKNNNTLNVEIRIDDGQIQLSEHFEAIVKPTDLNADGLLYPGLHSRYRLTYGTAASDINLYKDGKVRGGIGYVNSNRQMVSLGFLQ